MPSDIKFGCPLLGDEELDAVNSVLRGDILVHGPMAKTFEEDFARFTGAKHAVSVSSATAGMHLVYFALGIGPGDEVIVPAQTHVATAHAVELLGAKPVFVDCEFPSGNVSIETIYNAINEKTKAISVVHYLGTPVDLAPIVDFCRKKNIFLMEDCALSHGAYYDSCHTGLAGDAGVFSFYPVKHMTTAEGGIIVLKDDTLADRLAKLRAFGVNRNHAERKVAGGYDVDELGFNYRMSEVHAAIGVEQLKKLPWFLDRRRQNYLQLSKLLLQDNTITHVPQPVSGTIQSSHYCYGIILNDRLSERRNEIIASLAKQGVGTSVYYPGPVPMLTYYRNKYRQEPDAFPNAVKFSNSMLALPVGPHLGEPEVLEVAEKVNEVLRNMHAE